MLLQPSRIPRRRERPQLVDPHQRSHRAFVCRAPLSNLSFRPEEEHVVSGEDDVVPPFRRRHKAVKEPLRGLRPLETHL